LGASWQARGAERGARRRLQRGVGKADWDHSAPWLRHTIENAWKADLLVVQRQLTLVGINPALDGLKD